MRFSLDSDYLCAGLGNGSIQVYSTKTNGIACTLAFPNTNSNDNTKYPVTGIAFRPNRRDFKNQNVLVASCKKNDVECDSRLFFFIKHTSFSLPIRR